MNKCTFRQVLLLLAVVFVLPSYSQDKRSDIYAQHEVSIDAAKTRAVSFLQNKTSFRAANAADASFYQLAYTAQVDSHVCYYVFNRGNSEGFVIVSADDRTSEQILGYSTQGTFDYSKLPASAKAWVDGYAKGIATIQATNQAPAPTRAATRTPSSVAPLLGDIAWDQFAPFNNLCPEVDGEKCPTGCVATAMAQLMYYHRWPEVGHGSHSYEWNGQTLSADFNHEYHWDLMKPYYTGDITIDGVEASEEVAILMRDCGYSMNMKYELYGSGADINIGQPLVDYFDYDKDIHILYRDATTKEHYQNVVCEEIAKGRPVAIGDVSHFFLFDGYDEDGLVHTNFGWDGFGNAYYSIDNTGFDSNPAILYGLRKNEGNPAGFDLWSTNDFYVDEDYGEIECDLYFYYRVSGTDYGFSSVKAALAYENQDTHNIQYVVFSEEDNCVYWSVGGINLLTPTNLTDGIYHLYPVMSVDGSDWLRFTEPEKRQNFITVTVANGVATFSNDNLYDEVDPGRVEVNGIYYILNEDNTATVTWKNFRKASYSGHVVIPETFTYNGTEYTVTKIGETAFAHSLKLESVEIPASVTDIELGGFSIISAKTILFAPGSKLKSIGGWGFNGFRGEEIILPEGLKYLGECAFQGSNLKSIDLPASLMTAMGDVFNVSTNLTDVTVHWNTPHTFSSNLFNECPITNLYVPIGTKQKYAETLPWKQFANIIESEDVKCEPAITDVLAPVVEEGTDITEENAEDITEFKLTLNNVETFEVNEDASAELLIDGVLSGTAGKDDISEEDGVVTIKFNFVGNEENAPAKLKAFWHSVAQASGDEVPVEVIIAAGSFNINGEDVTEDISYSYTAPISVAEEIEETLSSIRGIAADEDSIKVYNLNGIRVSKNQKGIVIKNGKTFFVK